MRHTLVTGIALLVLSGLASTAEAQAVDPTLQVVQAKARFAHARRTGAARHKLKLTLQVSPRHLTDLHSGEQHALRVTLDGTDLCRAAPGADGYRTRKGGRWRYNGEIAGGRVRLSASSRSGKVKVKVTRAGLTALRYSPAVELAVSLELAGSVLATTASFRVDDRGMRRWMGLAYGFPPGTGTDPDPDPGPGDPPLSGAKLRAALLADLQRRGEPYFLIGTRYPGGGFNRVTLRCPSGMLAEVVPLSVPLPGSVDMFSDTAYVCRDRGQYWAHRTGGYAGVSLWLGPYDLP